MWGRESPGGALERNRGIISRTAMADTHILEHSGESGLDHANRLLWRGASGVRVTSMDPSLLRAIAGNRVLWYLSHSEKLHCVQITLGFSFFLPFFFSLGLNLLFFCEKRKSVRVSSFVCFLVFFCPR